jgi:hypothetical protein
MIIDCSRCVARDSDACGDCVVTALSGPGGVLELADEERSAIEAMSAIGLVSPIRLVEDRRSSSA